MKSVQALLLSAITVGIIACSMPSEPSTKKVPVRFEITEFGVIDPEPESFGEPFTVKYSTGKHRQDGNINANFPWSAKTKLPVGFKEGELIAYHNDYTFYGNVKITVDDSVIFNKSVGVATQTRFKYNFLVKDFK